MSDQPVRCGCGGKAITRHIRFCEQDLYLIYCEACGTETVFKQTEAEAVEAWNKAMHKMSGKWETEEDWDGDELYKCPLC